MRSGIDEGQSTKLEFRIENSSSEAMKLTGISTHAAGKIQIKLSNGQILDGNNTSILIDSEETLVFGNDGHEILMVGLLHPLKENETIGFNITLSNGAVRAWAHIHSPMGH